MTVEIKEQPDPVKNDNPALWDLVIEDMKKRDQIGLQKYGTRLQAGNGRDALTDLADELLDGLVYLKQLKEELKCLKTDLYNLLVLLVENQFQKKDVRVVVVSSLESILKKNAVLCAEKCSISKAVSVKGAIEERNSVN